MVSCSSFAYGGKTTQRNLEQGVSYLEGEFEHEKDRKSSYTVPYKPQKAPTQSVMIYRGKPEETPYEKLLMRAVPNQDGRKRITNTTEWPYLFHSQLSLHFPSGEYGGSGIIVGPHHILTAAHNVYDPHKKEWATSIIAHPALNDSMAPFGSMKAVKIFTFEDWIDKGDSNFDIALITLSSSIGLQTGWCGLLCLERDDLIQEEVRITGYPGDKGFNQMWTMSHVIKRVEPEKIFYDIDTYGGQSGSGIWINKWGNPYVIGIHTLGEGGKYEGNSGVRLSQGKFVQVISEWISKTRDIQQNIPKQISDKNTDISRVIVIEDKNKDFQVQPLHIDTSKDVLSAQSTHQKMEDKGPLPSKIVTSANTPSIRQEPLDNMKSTQINQTSEIIKPVATSKLVLDADKNTARPPISTTQTFNKVDDGGSKQQTQVVQKKLDKSEIIKAIEKVKNKESSGSNNLTILNPSYTSIPSKITSELTVLLNSDFSVTTLDLSNAKLGNMGLQILVEALENNKTVLDLNLEKNEIGHDRLGMGWGIKALSKFLKENKTLKSLNLKGNTLHYADELWNAFKDNNSITHLNLEGIWGDDWMNVESVKALGKALKYNQSITYLNIKKNSISDAAASSLATSLQENDTLIQLELSGNKIRKGGKKAFNQLIKERSNWKIIGLDSQINS